MSRLEYLRNKDKKSSNYLLRSSKCLSSSVRVDAKSSDTTNRAEDSIVSVDHGYRFRKKAVGKVSITTGESKLTKDLENHNCKKFLAKPCTIRLLLIDSGTLPHLCKKYNVFVSNFTLNQLKVEENSVLFQKNCMTIDEISSKEDDNLYNQHTHKNASIEPVTRTNNLLKDAGSEIAHGSKETIRDNDETMNKSTTQESINSEILTKNKSRFVDIMLNNSFSELICPKQKKSHLSLNLPSKKYSSRKADNKEPKPTTPRKSKISSERNCYKPLNIVVQKSPVRSKNKEMHEELSNSPPTTSTNSYEAAIRIEKRSRNSSFPKVLQSTSEISNFSKTKDNENQTVEIVEEKCKRQNPLNVTELNSSLSSETKQECTKHQLLQTSECIQNTVPGNQDDTVKYNARKRLEFSYNSHCNIPENLEATASEQMGLSCSETKERTQSSNIKSSNDVSCDDNDDDDCEIMSFYIEDVLDTSLMTPSFACQTFMKSQLVSQSHERANKVDDKEPEQEEEESLENQDSGNRDNAVSSSCVLSPNPSHASDEHSENLEEKVIGNECNYEVAFDDNGIEYAPLLRAPSWKEVAEYRSNVEPIGLPYCSDPDDIPNKPVEVGNIVLRLCSNRPNSLPPFENSLGIVGLEGHRRKVLENTFGGLEELEIGSEWEKISKAALLPNGGTREVIITACEDPPKFEDVSQWLMDEGQKSIKEKAKSETPYKQVEKSFKIIAKCPMDREDDDGDDPEVVSLSPCSSLGNQSIKTGSGLTVQSTPLSNLKFSKQQDEIASPSNSSLTFSPIRADIDEEDIILCTPPPHPVIKPSSDRKVRKSKSTSISWSRKRFHQSSITQKKIPEVIEEHVLDTPTKNVNVVHFCDDESCDPKKPKASEKDELKMQKIYLQKCNQNLVGQRSVGHSSCQIEGVSPNNTFGFQNSPNNLQDAKAIHQSENVTVMSLEVHVTTRGDLRPDPEFDSIRAIFYSVVKDCGGQMEDSAHKETGILMVDTSSNSSSCDILKRTGFSKKSVQVACDEMALFKILGELMKKWDPDILAGFEVEMQSWGYVLERGSFLGLDMKSVLSRIPGGTPLEVNFRDKTSEHLELGSKRIQDNEDYDPIHLPGRVVLNVWRLMRSEVALMSYTFENVMYHLLHERVPLHSFKSLNNWWEHRTHLYRWITVEYWITRVEGVMRLLFQLDLIGRTSELARLFGIQFYEVFSRGSQFRVESIMLRFAKPFNYVCVSPNSKQRASMKAPEQLPLIMEPESRFFTDPVIVLDFQSLYPSIIIAYNYCFSTCLGRVKYLGQPGPFEFGCTNLMIPPDQVAALLKKQKKLTEEDKINSRAIINFSPCGVAFVGKHIREGILPRMLSEILETRLMVKKALKENKGNRVVERVLNNRQLGLKLIANVTYGYTSANFSGRMPCIEVGDSVVSKGRETLERAIALVHEKWGNQGVRVVYGDTDSLFVLAKGFSRKEAFKLGAQIAEDVTKDNPKPVKLKLEKVYQPCLLQTKKRYVGYSYESPDQEKPIFDAKGIETVRRDGCPAVAKVLEKSLRLLFDTRDVSLVKQNVQRQFGKLLSGRLSLQELTFAREYRGAGGYRPGACVPALQLARRWISVDRRAEPRSGERVPYVIVSGPPGVPLFHLVRSPSEFLMLDKQASSSSGTANQAQMRINAHYYITRVLVPPLQRCFSLIGVDVESWYADMPRKFRSLIQPVGPSNVNDVSESSALNALGTKRSTIAEYFVTSDCLSCGAQLDTRNQVALCATCIGNPQSTAFILEGRCNSWERSSSYLTKICQSCCKRMDPIECTSLDCPVLYRRHQAINEMEQASTLRVILNKLLEF